MSHVPLRRRIAAGLVALTGAATLVAAQPAVPVHAAAPAATKVAVSWTGDVIRIKLTSPRAACKAARRTFVAYSFGATLYGGTGTTPANGVLDLNAGPPENNGRLVAFALRTKRCHAAQSPVTGVVAAPRAQRAAKARTTATISFDGTAFRVKVRSPKPACAKSRKVNVFGFERSRMEPSVIARAGTTNAAGVATLPLGTSSSGVTIERYVAFVRTSRGCRFAQSGVGSIAP